MATSLKNRKPRTKKPEAQAEGDDAGPPVVEGEESNPVKAVTKKHEKARDSNVLDETVREFCNKAAVAFFEFESARDLMKKTQNVYRAVLKDAKQAGIDQTAIAWWLNNRKREPDEIDRETRNRNRVAKLMGMPIGTQMGLFDDGPTVATAVDQEQLALRGALTISPYDLGYTMGLEGKAFAPGTLEGDDQEKALDGWKAAQEKLATSMWTSH